MTLYHITTLRDALVIVLSGFEDRPGYFGTEIEWRGVWLSDSPRGPNDGISGDAVLRVELDVPAHELAGYEWVEEGRGYREWLVPAALIRERGTVLLAAPEEA